MTSQATVPAQIIKSENSLIANLVFIGLGVLLLSLLAQLAFPLPWTPVPVTGQTFGVALIALLWGWKRGSAVVVSYVALGSLGWPLFTQAHSSLLLGPTFGYLVGMIVASFVVGVLADKGYTKYFTTALVASYLGSFFTFSFGLIGLSFFIPTESLFVAGVLPFLPGDLIKNVSAAFIASAVHRRFHLKK